MDELRSGPNRLVLDTFHAPAERATDKQLRKLVARALENPILQAVFEAVGGCGLVIDRHRQIIAANDTALSLLGAHMGRSIDGLRFGEAIDCVNACRGPNGCGTSIQCRHCGAVATMLLAQISDHPVDGNCTVTHGQGKDCRVTDLKLRITPLFLGGERVYFLVFQDVTAVKWHEVREHVFLHDLANLVMGLEGWVDELKEGPTEDTTQQILHMVHRLTDSLENHRTLIRAEAAEVQVVPETISFARLAEELRSQFAASTCARDHELTIDIRPNAGPLETDRRLLLRVLVNLMKNAFEASPVDGNVTLTIRSLEDSTVFDVHNGGTMAKEVASQLFRRRFSTKGSGRGLGIYSVQILGEHYLGGQVSFSSSESEGTVFHLQLPNRASRTHFTS
jgi:hypothetical protein